LRAAIQFAIELDNTIEQDDGAVERLTGHACHRRLAGKEQRSLEERSAEFCSANIRTASPRSQNPPRGNTSRPASFAPTAQLEIVLLDKFFRPERSLGFASEVVSSSQIMR